MSLKKCSILAVDDDPDVLIAVRMLLKNEVSKIVTEKNPENIPALLKEHNFDLLLLDMNFKSSIHTGNEGLFWLKRVKDLKPNLQVIMITAYADIDLAVRSLKEGAFDFMVKPWHNEKLISTIEDALERNHRQQRADARNSKDSIIGTELLGESEVMQDIFYKISKIAPTDANILDIG